MISPALKAVSIAMTMWATLALNTPWVTALLAIALSFSRVLASGDDPYLWTIGGKLNKDSYQTPQGLDRLEFIGDIDLKKKWGLGSYAPVFGVNFSYEFQQFTQNEKDRKLQT